VGLVLVLILYLIATVLLYRFFHLIFDIGYQILASTVSYYWSGGILVRHRILLPAGLSRPPGP
jgi:hypothetical protein